MDFDLVFQQVIDRQDRNKLKDASATGTTGDTPLTGHSHYRTRTRLMTTCLVGLHPIEAITTPCRTHQRRDTSHDTSQETDFASYLDIQDYTGHQDYQPPS